ncbi:hypothetical protein KAX02_02925 [candidate division WOR-3 bacterium]|nr:hypothetical protein [candidate division WOR-3 bacterium]
MKQDKKMVTIYVDKTIWQEIKDYAWQKRISAGTYLVELHKLNKDNSFNKPEPPETITETPKKDLPKSTISTGGRPEKAKKGTDNQSIGFSKKQQCQ